MYVICNTDVSKLNLQMPFKCVLAEITAVNVSHSGRGADCRSIKYASTMDWTHSSDQTTQRILFYLFDVHYTQLY